MSAAIAGYAMDAPVTFRFKGRVAHWEGWLEGASYRDRVAAMLLCLYLGRVYRTQNDYNDRHRRYYEANFDAYVQKLGLQVDRLAAEMHLTGYYGGDFIDHLDQGIEEGAALIISAPFIQGWYERWFRFINENLEWDEPAYKLWRPEDFPDLIDKLDDSGCDYVAVYKDELPGRNMIAYHRLGMKPPFYVYANRKRVSSVVSRLNTIFMATMLAGGAVGGGGDHEVAMLRHFQRLRVFERWIGGGQAKAVRRIRPGGAEKRKAIFDQALVDQVCVGGMTISEVLRAHGWAVAPASVDRCRQALQDALDRMRGSRAARPKDLE